MNLGAHERAGSVVRCGYQAGGVYRDDAAGSVEHVAAEAGVTADLEEAARPEAQLARVEIERVIDIAPEIGAGAAAAGRDVLRGQEQIQVQYDTLLPEIIAHPAPITGEPWSGQEVPAPGRRHLDRLCVGRISGEQQDQADQQHRRFQDVAHVDNTHLLPPPGQNARALNPGLRSPVATLPPPSVNIFPCQSRRASGKHLSSKV